MSQIDADRLTDNVEFGVEDGYALLPAMPLQAEIGADRQANMVALGAFETKLTGF
jgi:hypothetical protein